MTVFHDIKNYLDRATISSVQIKESREGDERLMGLEECNKPLSPQTDRQTVSTPTMTIAPNCCHQFDWGWIPTVFTAVSVSSTNRSSVKPKSVTCNWMNNWCLALTSSVSLMYNNYELCKFKVFCSCSAKERLFSF